ncbi:hypothetical protein BU26DRAFT_258061 [Trematosphaeria pertusa]|uniref:Uncharacterized protein n=1 Tax=Trematosphaeria pertusa TaxID=390896 RepID=A0A6A6IPY8_9PLEO|nr:uncharacterized protein BU26DRAFT_258061 [Trematosphaeria pertusa]KAF2252521.1 hypothetical protein BU26DRAFT_258061 [Trematosphaeria pertusa]
MAEVLGIISGLYGTGQALGKFAKELQNWQLLSERLFDITEGLHVAELTLAHWQHKYDIQERRHPIYTEVLFGRKGWERIQGTLGSIKITSRTIRDDVDSVVGRALKASSIPVTSYADALDDEELVKACLRRIRRNMAWSKKFVYSVLGKADDLELRLRRLHWKLSLLERQTELYLEKEHPEVYQTIKRLSGRRVILKIDDGRMDAIQHNIVDALSARRDADLLHRASGHGNRVHLGLSVPQIHKRDFSFLLSLNGHTHEVLVRPVRIKAIYDQSRVQSDISSAASSLIRNTHQPCYLLPSTSHSAGFEISIPPTDILAALEYKDSLSTLIRAQDPLLSQQVLYPQDQCALAGGIAQGTFRLIGSQWLHFLDCKNIRWRRNASGQWTTMMAAVPGDGSITRTLRRCLDAEQARRVPRDLTKHIQIFRIGLVLAELALKTPINYIDFDAGTATVKIHIRGLNEDDDVVDAEGIAAEVEKQTNILVGNMVFFCLSVLQDRDVMADRNVESGYYKDVVSQAEELRGFIEKERRRRIVPGP